MPTDAIPTADTVPIGRPLALDTPPPAPPVELLAGRYQLVRIVGHGGMGDVYEAEQFSPVRRTVAVKLVRRGPDSDEIAPRLEAERQALARMAHPNIAVVHDAGTAPDGRPFVVMEFVSGSPITDYADAHTLGVAERVELVRTVCTAVQHAHQKGIIHRDLKPGNVLVAHSDAGPVPKVIDFGLAKAVRSPLTDARMTTAGMIVGTPLYMAPEQTDPAADVDTRADVFALGVILYELLAGTTPLDPLGFQRADPVEQFRQIRSIDPPPPSARLDAVRAKLIRGDLDAVTLKALSRDPADRYPTAAAFADDLRRVLADEPVSIGRTTARTRARRFIRRNRGVVAAAAAVFVALTAGGALATVGFLRSRAAEADTRAALRQVEEQSGALAAALAKVEAEKAETAAALGREAAERAKAGVARDRTRKALEAAADLNTAGLVARTPLLSEVDRAHLTRLAVLIAGLDSDAADATERGNWIGRVGYMYEKLGEHPKATEAYARAVAVSTDPVLKAWHLQKQARHHVLLFRLEEGEKAYREAVALATPLLPRPEARISLIEGYEGLAALLVHLRRLPEAREAAKTSLALADALRADGHQVGHEVLIVSQVSSTLAAIALMEGKWDENLAHYQAAAAALRTSALDPNSPVMMQKLATTQLNLVRALTHLERFDEAIAASREAIRLAEVGLVRYPGLEELRVALGTACLNLAGLLSPRGGADRVEAAAMFNRTIDMLDVLANRPGRENDQSRMFRNAALYGRAEWKLQEGDEDGADADYRRVLDSLNAEDRDKETMMLVRMAFDTRRPRLLARFAENLLAQDVPGSADRAAYVFAMCTLLPIPKEEAERYTESAIRAIRRVPPDELPGIGIIVGPKMEGFRKRPGVADALAGKRPPEAPPPRVKK